MFTTQKMSTSKPKQKPRQFTLWETIRARLYGCTYLDWSNSTSYLLKLMTTFNKTQNPQPTSTYTIHIFTESTNNKIPQTILEIQQMIYTMEWVSISLVLHEQFELWLPESILNIGLLSWVDLVSTSLASAYVWPQGQNEARSRPSVVPANRSY